MRPYFNYFDHLLSRRQSSVNGDCLSQWQRANFHPCIIDTPQPITYKFVAGDLSTTPTATPNLVHIRPRGLLCVWVKYNLNYLFIYTPFAGNSPSGQTRRRIVAHDVSNDLNPPGDVPFWVSLTLLHI